MKNMIKKQYFLVMIATAALLVAGAGVYMYVNNASKITGKYKAVDRTLPTCTLDLGRSACGVWTVTLKDSSGQEKAYTVEGYDSKGQARERFEAIEEAVGLPTEQNHKKIQVTVQGETITSAKALD